MSNLYVQELNRVKSQPTHLASEIGDQWCTPDWLYLALNELYGPYVVDLFTDGQNSKCPVYYTADDNALRQDWSQALARGAERSGADPIEPIKCFGNPPYSIKRAAKGRNADHMTGMTHIMAKAYKEHLEGVPSHWLVKSATSESWWPNELWSRVIHIKGRIGFDPPTWYRADELAGTIGGAGFGASLIIFNGEDRIQHPEEYIYREALMDIGMPLAKLGEEQRQRWIKTWDEL